MLFPTEVFGYYTTFLSKNILTNRKHYAKMLSNTDEKRFSLDFEVVI